MSDNQHDDPEASRPVMPPEYGMLGATEGRGLLPWTWAAERLTQSRGYWLATAWPDGRPHMAVVWGIWLHDHFYFFTGATSRKARNLAANPRCVVCPEQTDEAVIVEGVAEVVTDPTVLRTFVEAYAAKYQEEVDTAAFITYGVRPVMAFGAISEAVDWPGSATRWRFRAA
jgi:PPOX class probable F420-dependent enzyme